MSTIQPKFPHVVVKLIGSDGNVFSILGATTGAMRLAGVDAEDIMALRNGIFDCESYQAALRLIMETVTVE